ncbi:response regulator [Blautia sp. MSJ-9]|uniref:response regulator n=1 Tax=Blautia sp. MSJ-9 TaxID=2841511 RepID=UPI002FE6C761
MTATRTIRSLNRKDARTVPITAISANAFEDDIQKSLDAGMNAHIAKPVDTVKLLTVVEELIN